MKRTSLRISGYQANRFLSEQAQMKVKTKFQMMDDSDVRQMPGRDDPIVMIIKLVSLHASLP